MDPTSPVKPKFALIVRTPPPPDYTRFNETLYADRTISALIPQWRNQVKWRIVIHELPQSPDALKELLRESVWDGLKGFGGKPIPHDFTKAITSEFTDTEGHKGILVQVFD